MALLTDSHAFSGFSVKDIAEAQQFYGTVLGLKTEQTPQGLQLHIAGGKDVFLYPKPDHIPSEFTILNFPVDDIDAAVDELLASGVTFEHYGEAMHQDEKGIARGRSAGMGPDIAWFKDPSGNILSILH
ncbi:MAG: glyoxalase [Parcubacteria group bacterium]|nr:glyoxalase [Parcubacteria group bacterium]